ncbi:MAG: hypothetical protein E7414_05875 [Ruminococcaceae bacterium]|nr:hypothetical protein [Oscillospiraceae bacterium]
MDIDEKKLQQTEKTYEHIGRLMAEGLSQGISNNKQKAEQAIENFNEDLLRAEQFYLEEKKRLQQEYDAAEEEKHRRDYQIKLQKAKTFQQAETVQINERLRLQKKANEEYLESLSQSLMEAEARFKEHKQRITDDFDAIARRATESLGELEEAREKMAAKISGYGNLFQERSVFFLNSGVDGASELFEEVLPDLTAQREELERYAAFLQEIQNRTDIPAELFHAIRELSISDALRFKESLLSLDKQELAAYVEDWQAIASLSKQTAEASFAEETRQALERVEQELEGWYGSIPAGFFQEGELSAEAFGTAFMNKLADMKETLNQAVLSVVSDSAGQMTLSAEGRDSRAVGNTQNSVTYVLSGAGETVAEQLRSARAHAEIAKLRGGY